MLLPASNSAQQLLHCARKGGLTQQLRCSELPSLQLLNSMEKARGSIYLKPIFTNGFLHRSSINSNLLILSMKQHHLRSEGDCHLHACTQFSSPLKTLLCSVEFAEGKNRRGQGANLSWHSLSSAITLTQKQVNRCLQASNPSKQGILGLTIIPVHTLNTKSQISIM